MSDLPIRVLGDRVLVKPDTLDNAPERLASGIVLAKSLAAAVTGSDAEHSITRGVVIAVGHPKHPKEAEALELADRIVAWHVMTWEEDSELLRDLVRREPCCNVGDDVLFSYDAGQALTIEDESYILLHENDLLAVVEPEPVA